MKWPIILVTGSGDEATAVAVRLFRSGFKVILIVHNKPVDLHYHRNFTRCIFSGTGQIEGVSAITFSLALQQDAVSTPPKLTDFISFALANRQVPIILLDELKRGQLIEAQYIIKLDDEIFNRLKSHLPDEIKVIGVKPEPGVDFWIGRQGKILGQVQYPFLEERKENNLSKFRRPMAQEIEAPLEGVFVASKGIGERVFEREEIGKLNEIPILSPYHGVISGLINSGALVKPHTPLAEVTTGLRGADPRRLPVEAFALAGGVLEAILYDWKERIT